MSTYKYERLSAQDNSFLLLEHPSVYMHVAATSIYDAGPLRTAQGGIDIAAFKRGTEAVLHLIPRYRQKLKWIPYFQHPVWVDDRRFSLDYHVRHTALPRPGSDVQLKALAARIMAQQLDRSKPLWEFWVVEGLSDDRFALISKIHHCMIDGSSGVDLATVLMSLTPEHEHSEVHPYIPRPVPHATELVRDELLRVIGLPVAAVRSLGDFRSQTDDLRAEVIKRLRALAELAGYAIRAASKTPLNGRLGPHRVFDWLSVSLDEVKAVRRTCDCTVNDLVLATVAGAVRSYLIRRRVNPDEVDFRVSAPVSVRREEDRGKLGNKVSSWILRLPIGEKDPLARLRAIREVTEGLKKSEQALGVQMLMAAAEWAPAQLLSLGSQATQGPINMIVTNVPGPQVPLYMLGAKLLAMYPMVPLLENTGLGVALFSYDGKLLWGFNADPGLVPDLPAFVRMIATSFAELRDQSRVAAAPAAPAPPVPVAAADAPASEESSEESVVVFPSNASRRSRPS